MSSKLQIKCKYPISTDIPVDRSRPSRTSYPWYDLGVGHSFLVPRTLRNNVRICMNAMHKRHPMRFLSRETHDGIRVWRVK